MSSARSTCLRIDAHFSRRLAERHSASRTAAGRSGRSSRLRNNAPNCRESAFSSTRFGIKAETDLAGTLGQLAKIGYKEIEFAGYYNHPATEVREILDKNGLTAPSAHLGIDLHRGRRGRPDVRRREDGRPRMDHGARRRRANRRRPTTGSASPSDSTRRRRRQSRPDFGSRFTTTTPSSERSATRCRSRS